VCNLVILEYDFDCLTSIYSTLTAGVPGLGDVIIFNLFLFFF